MKRAFFEWGALAASGLVLFCFGYWIVLLYAPQARAELFLPLGHWKSTQILVSDGLVTINDHYGSKEGIEELAKYRAVSPPITSKTQWALPGFLYQSIDWSGRLSWSLQFSLLLPALFSALAAGVFICGYLRVRREALRAFLRRSPEARVAPKGA